MLLDDLEYSYLPNFVLLHKEKFPDEVYKTLISKFPTICVEHLQSISNSKNVGESAFFDKTNYKVKRLPSRYICEGCFPSDAVVYKFITLAVRIIIVILLLHILLILILLLLIIIYVDGK